MLKNNGKKKENQQNNKKIKMTVVGISESSQKRTKKLELPLMIDFDMFRSFHVLQNLKRPALASGVDGAWSTLVLIRNTFLWQT